MREVEKLDLQVTKHQLARLKSLERVLGHIRLQNETYTHNETYQRVCIIFIDNIILSTRAALIPEVTDNMSRGKSHLPEILQRKFEEIKGYLEKLQEKNNEIDLVINEIEEKLERQNYELTEKGKDALKKLLEKVDRKSGDAKICVEAAEKALVFLSSEVESYRRKQSVSGWNVFLSVAAGAGVGALGVAFFPEVAPAAAVCGGGLLSGGFRILYEKEANDGDYKMLRVESKKLESRLLKLKTDLKFKELVIDNEKKKIESEVRITGEVRGEI